MLFVGHSSTEAWIKSISKDSRAAKESALEQIDLCDGSNDVKNVVCESQRTHHWSTLKEKPLHGKFVNWCCSNPIDLSRSFHWHGELFHSESESTIFAVQDQVVRTRVYERKIMHVSGPTVMCRLCNNYEESIQHLMAGCPTLAPTSYLIVTIWWPV